MTTDQRQRLTNATRVGWTKLRWQIAGKGSILLGLHKGQTEGALMRIPDVVQEVIQEEVKE